MSYSNLPLSYCTNVHPGRTLSEVLEGLENFAAPIARRCEKPVAAGLWLAAPVVREIHESAGSIERLREGLQRGSLTCYTLNAFPYGDFHSTRVKENVYLPDWSDRRRLDYTLDCAKILAQLLPAGESGSISTLPLGFKQFEHPAGHREACIRQLLDAAEGLSQIEAESGRMIRLAIEPEPFCLLETTGETVQFFTELFRVAETKKMRETAQNFLGVCYDVCHQAVEFEDIPGSLAELQRAGIRVNKVHITCALELRNPGSNREGRIALAKFAEPRYLHQTLAKCVDGSLRRVVDITSEFVMDPPSDFLNARAWRIHFHVPVNAEQVGHLQTTRSELVQALRSVEQFPYAPHLEVETYTWSVLPDAASENEDRQPQLDQKLRLIDGMARELLATQDLLGEAT